MAERLLAGSLALAFWLPLAICTWLALMPAPPNALAHISDIILHGAALAYLAFAARLTFGERTGSARRSDLTVAVGLLGYGALIELLQGLGGVRMAEWGDLAVDAVGIALGLAVHRLIGARTRSLLAEATKRLLG